MNHRLFAAAACLAALLGVACQPRRPLDYWFVDSLTKVFPEDARGVGEAPPRFSAARRSRTSIQIAMRSRQTLGDLYADAMPLTGPGLPIDNVRVRWVEYVVVTSNTPDTPDGELVRKAPALFPDALLDTFPITLKKDQTRSIWLTVNVPPGQAPGEYQGVLRLRQGREILADAPYTVVVSRAETPARIPLAVSNHFNLSDKHIRQFYGCSRYTEEWWGLMVNIARFLRAYHQTSMVADALSLVAAEAAGGNVRYDFGNFERFVEAFQSAGIDGSIEGGNLLTRAGGPDGPVLVRAWILEDGRPALRALPVGDARAQRFLETFLPALYGRWEARGWAGKYLQGIIDEPLRTETVAFANMSALVRRLMPKVRTIAQVDARQDLSVLEKSADIQVPCLGSFDEETDARAQQTRRAGTLWFYTGRAPRGRYPNRFIDYSLTKVRILQWINFKYGFDGFRHWGGNYWGPEPFEDTQPVIDRTYLSPGDAFITYPNSARRSLYSSIRLEQMREGIEDYGLLVELRRREPARAQALVNEAVRSIADYVRSPEQFRRIYERLLAE